MVNKNPFEIRLELLNLANSILLERYWAERNRIENDWNAQRVLCEKEGTPVPDAPFVDDVDEDEIIALAKKLNEFVSNG
jgi:hypothetical protein